MLVHFVERTGTGAARVAAASTGSGRWRKRGRALSGNGEDGELRFELPGVALGALGLFLAVNEGFEVVIALFADVFEDRHKLSDLNLKSNGGGFANLKCGEARRRPFREAFD